jgi:hypothetical protein
MIAYATYTAENDELVIEYVARMVDTDDGFWDVRDIRIHTVTICGIEQDVSIFDDATVKAMEKMADDLEFE